jgi:hypothetical protein
MTFAKSFAACLLDRRRKKVINVTSALFTRNAVLVGLLWIDGLDLDIVVANNMNFLNFLDSLGSMAGSWLAGAQICRRRVVLRFYFVNGSAKSSAYFMPMVNI